jgi:macrodomain Ter protein organizer (MatP/YcbG family)
LEGNGSILVLDRFAFNYHHSLAKETKVKKIRSVRVSDQLWARAKAKARAEGRTISEVIVDFLKEFIK